MDYNTVTLLVSTKSTGPIKTVSIQLNRNLLAETNDFKLVIEDPSDLEGLPDQLIQETAESALNASGFPLGKKTAEKLFY